MSSLLLHYSAVRWKEWIPFVTQQQRFRNLIQIIGYNIGRKDEDECKFAKDVSYFYTLHLTTMCAPFYTSEQIFNHHPKWAEINFQTIDPSYGSATGLVVRVWEHYQDTDSIVTVWGLYFSGLANIGSHVMSQGRMAFTDNTLVFCMHGGCFTATEYFVNDEPIMARITALSVNRNDVRKSYTIESLSRLHSTQRSIKEFTEDATELHNKIIMGEFPDDKSQIKENSAIIRRLLNQNKPAKVSHEQILSVKRDIEVKQFRIQLLQELKSKKLGDIKQRKERRAELFEMNNTEGKKLTKQFENLKKDLEKMKKFKEGFFERREDMAIATSLFSFRQRQLIAELTCIYPIKKSADSKYTICDVYLPNSEDFDGVDELSLSVALGFTAHLVQMISFIINIPLRYPIIHFGSRSKVVDHITDQIPDKDREFPLFTKGKDRLQFNYAVYLLNKNVAQLRWYCGIATDDLRNTLPNLETLLNMYSAHQTVRSKGKFISEELARPNSISRNSVHYSSIPSRFNHRKYEVRSCCSLDGDLNEWDSADHKSELLNNVSEPLCLEDAQSSDSVEQDFIHIKYVSTPPPNKD